ncbi:MAG: hypothetical protein HZY76_04845 [Anaerolineae bacterium]|nr:MAG: hypothetical protein HZY76_04845 [Anaerolineae bacterium]
MPDTAVADATAPGPRMSQAAVATPSPDPTPVASAPDNGSTPEAGVTQDYRLFFPVSPGLPPRAIGQIGGSIDAVALRGDRAYAGMGPRLVIFDVSNPAMPRLLGRSPILPDLVSGVAVEGSVAYVAAGAEGGLQIIDVSDPGNPQILGSYNSAGQATSVAVSGGLVYLADGAFGGLQIIDVLIPQSPTIVGQIDTPGDCLAVQVAGGRVRGGWPAGRPADHRRHLTRSPTAARRIYGTDRAGCCHFRHTGLSGQWLYWPAGGRCGRAGAARVTGQHSHGERRERRPDRKSGPGRQRRRRRSTRGRHFRAGSAGAARQPEHAGKRPASGGPRPPGPACRRVRWPAYHRYQQRGGAAATGELRNHRSRPGYTRRAILATWRTAATVCKS